MRSKCWISGGLHSRLKLVRDRQTGISHRGRIAAQTRSIVWVMVISVVVWIVLNLTVRIHSIVPITVHVIGIRHWVVPGRNVQVVILGGVSTVVA